MIRGLVILCGTSALLLAAARSVRAGAESDEAFQPVKTPAWVSDVTRMAFCGVGDLDAAQKAGVQVVHTNVVWPYYPLRRDGGGLSNEDDARLREVVEGCHKRGMKLVLGLPPFPPLSLLQVHPDWRVHSDEAGSIVHVEPVEQDLGTRLSCNNGPWGDYLIDVCGELVRDHGVDGFSFDGNYHPRLCFCPWCKASYKRDTGCDLPRKIGMDDLAYREYLVWRGYRLEDFYRRLQARIKGINPDAVLMSWSVNAGRLKQLLTSPREMPTRLNLLFDLPMQEWWLNEPNLGASVAPTFGVAYLRAVAGDRPGGPEAYIISREYPYTNFGLPSHERVARTLLAVANGCVPPLSFGWPGHFDDTLTCLGEIAKREPWITHTRQMPWAALLVSEQTRQFYAYQDIAERFLPHVYGAFRVALEEHLACNLINDWDVNPRELAKYRVLILPNAAALSDRQVKAIREYVRAGGGLVATCETSLLDELGRPRHDFGLSDVFGVAYKGRPKAVETRPDADAAVPITVDEEFWKERIGVAEFSLDKGLTLGEPRLADLAPGGFMAFEGPQVLVAPRADNEVVMRMKPTGNPPEAQVARAAAVVRNFGNGRVVYLAAGLDAALWSYPFPYSRALLRRAIDLAAGAPFAISVKAPMCVQATFFEQEKDGRRIVVHLLNGLDTGAGHGKPGMDVPLREETVAVHGIEVRFEGIAAKQFHVEPGGLSPEVRREGSATVVMMPPLELHAMLVAEL